MSDRLPTYHDRELGLACAERINNLLGLRLKYLVSIPIGLGAGYLAGLAGAGQMVTVVAFVAAQIAYGVWLGWFEAYRRRVQLRKISEMRRALRLPQR